MLTKEHSQRQSEADSGKRDDESWSVKLVTRLISIFFSRESEPIVKECGRFEPEIEKIAFSAF